MTCTQMASNQNAWSLLYVTQYPELIHSMQPVLEAILDREGLGHADGKMQLQDMLGIQVAERWAVRESG